MFCIAAFIVFAILALFSATYRPLAAKAWYCVLRRVTFRPCDINFGEELKGRLIGKYVVTRPGFARFLSRWIDWFSAAFVVLSIWSLLYVANAGLNLWVYDTCTPSNAESCSLGGEACGIDQSTLTLRAAIAENRLGEWATGPFVRFGETISRIPDRVKVWEPKEYLSSTATFYGKEDPAKPYAIEIVDPSCKFCKKLFQHLTQAGIDGTHNLSYLLYPIPVPDEEGKYKFSHSDLMVATIEAAKTLVPVNPVNDMPADWQLLARIFTEGDETSGLQQRFIMGFTRQEAQQMLDQMLRDVGYSEEQVQLLRQRAQSPEVQERLAEQAALVTERIRTRKIPTLLIGGRRFDRVISVEQLRKAADL